MNEKTISRRLKKRLTKLRRIAQFIEKNQGRQLAAKQILNEITPKKASYGIINHPLGVTAKMKVLKQPIVRKTNHGVVFKLTNNEAVKKWNNPIKNQ